MMLIDYSNFDSLLESYYGKTKELKIIEKELEAIIELINRYSEASIKEIKLDKRLSNIANSKHISNIEKQFEKLFKLDKFYLSFYTSLPFGIFFRINRNAFTIPMAYNFFRKKDKWNRVDSSGLSFGVNVDMALVRYAQLNAEELLAIILHEIGHNMNASIFNLLAKGPINFIADFVKLGAGYSKLNKGIEKGLDNFTILKKATSTIFDIYNNIKTIRNVFIVIDFNLLIDVLLRPSRIASLHTIFGYTDEKYSDSFATAYGYGPALATGLNKMTLLNGRLSNNLINKVPGINWYYDFTNVMIRILVGIVDSHPHTAVRISSQLKKLKKDINDPKLDPRVKVEVEKDIEELEDFINNEYIKFTENKNSSRIFSWVMNYIIIKVFKGKADLRDAFDIFKYEE